MITDGYNDEGTAAYVYLMRIWGSGPLYYLCNEGDVDCLYTTNEAERAYAIEIFGYSDEKIKCYVLPVELAPGGVRCPIAFVSTFACISLCESP